MTLVCVSGSLTRVGRRSDMTDGIRGVGLGGFMDDRVRTVRLLLAQQRLEEQAIRDLRDKLMEV